LVFPAVIKAFGSAGIAVEIEARGYVLLPRRCKQLQDADFWASSHGVCDLAQPD